MQQRPMIAKQFSWVGLGWVGLGWVGLGWVGLDWVGLGWVGLGWAVLGWVVPGTPQNACPAHNSHTLFVTGDFFLTFPELSRQLSLRDPLILSVYCSLIWQTPVGDKI